MIKDFAGVPISRHLMLELLKDYASPNDKISELIKSRHLISIKRGLYITGPETDLPAPEPFLIANHLKGPSYVSLESALSYWGLIPERVHEISSVTTRTSKKYKTSVGRYTYWKLPVPYYAFGINCIELSAKQNAMIASPEKALCDKIILTSGINLRSQKQTIAFLTEDLRMDEEKLQTLNTTIIQTWLEDAPKSKSLQTLVKTLNDL